MDKRLKIFLILIIFIGIFFRFYGLETFRYFMHGDEYLYIISGMKMFHQSFEDGRSFVIEHPPLARWVLGLPTMFIDADYRNLNFIGANMYVFSFIASELIQKVYIPMRMMAAFLGTISIILIYLITRKIFDYDSALWAAVISSMSIDLIIYSRVALLDMPMITFALSTIYFYIKYISEEKYYKYAYLGLMTLSLIFLLASKIVMPWIFIPIILISVFLARRGMPNLMKNIYFSIIIFICIFVTFNIVYPKSFMERSQQDISLKGPDDMIGFSLASVMEYPFLRNSYLFTFSFILLCYFFYMKLFGEKKKFDISFVKKIFTDSKLNIIVVLFFVIFFGFSFSRWGGASVKYLMLLSLPIFMFSGKVLSSFMKSKHFKYILILVVILIGLNIFFVVYDFPYGMFRYSNFGIDSAKTLDVTRDSYNEEIIKYLNENGKPEILSNDVDMLVFYEGNSIPFPILSENRCVKSYFEELRKQGVNILYEENSGRTVFNDPYVCTSFFNEIPLKLEKGFNNMKLYSFE